MTVVQRMHQLSMEGAYDVLARAKAMEAEGKEIIHLEIGEPDFDTPPHITESGIEALRKGYTHYSPTAGLTELREAIARNVRVTRSVSVTADQVIVTPGAKPVMFFTILALVKRGDEVLYTNPGYPIYESLIRFCGARPVPVRLLDHNGYHFDMDDMSNKISAKTKMIILNSPQNPAGCMMSKRDIDTLAGLLKNREDVYVLTDEIYKDIIYEGAHHSIASHRDMTERTIILDGFSKAYAMTGWRLGYGVFPSRLVPHITRLAANAVSCAATFPQIAAIQALEGTQRPLKDMVEEYRKRRDLIVDGLQNIPGIRCPKPQGAFYVFPNVRGTGIGSREFQERALMEAGVALLSGASFGKFGEGYVRLSYANSKANIEKALDRLHAFVVENSRKVT